MAAAVSATTFSPSACGARVKYEEVYLTEYANPREARHGLGHYFPFYNHERPHQALDYQTPAAVYFQPATA